MSVLCGTRYVYVLLSCERVCVWVCWNPVFQLLAILLSGCAAATAYCHLYHTVPQALKPITLLHPRYNSSRTARLCGPPLSHHGPCVCWRRLCVCDLCATGVCLGLCGWKEACYHRACTFWLKRFLSDGSPQPKIVGVAIMCVAIRFVVYMSHGIVHRVALLFFS